MRQIRVGNTRQRRRQVHDGRSRRRIEHQPERGLGRLIPVSLKDVRRIEGTRASLSEIFQAEAVGDPGHDSGDVAEVENHLQGRPRRPDGRRPRSGAKSWGVPARPGLVLGRTR